MVYFPAVLFPVDSAGLHGCLVPDLLVNASGRTADEALRDAAAIVDELLGAMAQKGEPYPEPTPVEEINLDGGTLVLLASSPRRAAA